MEHFFAILQLQYLYKVPITSLDVHCMMILLHNIFHTYRVFHYTNTCTRHSLTHARAPNSIVTPITTTTLYISNKSNYQGQFFPIAFFPLDYTFGVCTHLFLYICTNNWKSHLINKPQSQQHQHLELYNNAFNLWHGPSWDA